MFAGMTNHEIVSFVLGFILFNGYVVLLAITMAVFYASSRPRRGRVRTAAIWHFLAACCVIWSFISLVWAAPVEKSFIDATQASEPYFTGAHFEKILIGLGFAAVAVGLMIIGVVQGASQKRAAVEQALRAETPAGAAGPG
jgi:hypothetical protein